MKWAQFWGYLWQWLRHKWWVFYAGRKIGCSWWLLLWHDFSKLRPSEFPHHVRRWMDSGGKLRDQPLVDDGTVVAKTLHHNRSPHHWQFWCYIDEQGEVRPQKIPTKYVYEMVADWWGAGRSQRGTWTAHEHWHANKHKIKLHPETYAAVDALMLLSAAELTEKSTDDRRLIE